MTNKNTATSLFTLQSRNAWKDTGNVNVTTLCVNVVKKFNTLQTT